MMGFLMTQVERWQRVRQTFVAGHGNVRRKMPLWRAYALAVSLANDPCDEMALPAEGA